jgi:hypothetical protein
VPDNRRVRIAGWCALLSVLTLVGAIFTFAVAEWLGVALEYISLLMLLVVFYALYVVHRSDSPTLSLAGLILMPVALVADMVGGASDGNATLGNIWYVSFSLPFLVFGFVMFRSARMSRGLAVLALAVGAVYLVAGAGGVPPGLDLRGLGQPARAAPDGRLAGLAGARPAFGTTGDGPGDPIRAVARHYRVNRCPRAGAPCRVPARGAT